jgi:hypothetical protein
VKDIKLKTGETYIFITQVGKTVYKAKILEITDFTYLILWENGNKVRWHREQFHHNYKVLEHIQTNYDETFEKLK